MSLARKLNLKPGMKVRVIGKPAMDFGDVETTTRGAGDAMLAFVKTVAEVDATCAPVIAAAALAGIAWVAYPKAGQLGTDLNRDILWKHMQTHGIQGVRQIALDDVWSAMRFRPK